jgi:hypothetical protein
MAAAKKPIKGIIVATSDQKALKKIADIVKGAKDARMINVKYEKAGPGIPEEVACLIFAGF